MKKTLITFVLIFFTFLTFGQEIKYVNTEQLNIRSGAGSDYDIIDKASQGTKLTIISNQGKWSEVELENGKKGFVSTKFLSDTKEEPKKKKGNIWTIVLIVGGLILYWLFKSPSNSSSTNSPRQKSSPKPKPNHWYHCKNCNEKIQSSKMPTGLNCSNSTFHKWTDLGEVGEDAYNCKNCGTTIYTNRMPTGLNCARDTFHKWTKLS
jgi:uncharacterized protein YgiM (DUF1202 family)